MTEYKQTIPYGTKVQIADDAKMISDPLRLSSMAGKKATISEFDHTDNTYQMQGSYYWLNAKDITILEEPELVVQQGDKRVYRVAGRDNGAAPKGRVWIIDNARHNDPAHIGFLRYESEISPYVAPPTVWEKDVEYLFLHEYWTVTAVDDAGNALLKHVTPEGTASIRAAAASEISQATKKT